MPPSREHRMTFPKLSDNCPWTNSWTNPWTKFCKMPISSCYHFFTFYGQKKSCKPEFIGFTAFILLWDQQGSKMSTKSLKTPVSIVFQKSVDNFMGTKIYFYPFNTSLSLSALDLGLAAHTIVLVICLPVITECRIEVRDWCCGMSPERSLPMPVRAFQHPERDEMHPELIRRLETSGQQIRIPSAVVCRIEYRRQIDALIDPIRDSLWPEPCIDLRCDGSIDQQIVDIRPRAESRRNIRCSSDSVLGSRYN